MNVQNSLILDDDLDYALSGIQDEIELTPDDILKNLYIMNKNSEIVPLELNRIQLDLSTKLTGRDLILKPRQVGISTYVQAYCFAHAITRTSRQVTLCNDDKLTSKMRRMVGRFYEQLPDKYTPARGSNNASTTTYPSTHSEVEIDTAGNKTAGRGGTADIVHGTEVAFWNNPEDNISGLLNSVPIGKGQVFFESTANGAQGWFYDESMRSMRGESIWTLHFYEWWWQDEYTLPLNGEILTYTDEEQALVDKHNLSPEQINWRRYKIKEDPHKFLQEYPEDIITCFLTSNDSYFGNLDGRFKAPQGAVYNPDHEYVAGLDFGQHKDFTALIILDKTTYQHVDTLHINQMSWEDMRSRVIDKLLYWNALCVPETNSMGWTNIEALQAYEYTVQNENDKPITKHLEVKPFTTTNRSKRQAIQLLYKALHEDDLQLLDDILLRNELLNFTSKQTDSGAWTYSAAGDGHDDLVIALALAVVGLFI